jgi:hypothetical protein
VNTRALAFAVQFTALCAAAGLAQQAPAQHPPDQAQVRAELARLQRDLETRRAEGDRLLELRIRHDLGLPIDEDVDTFHGDAPSITTAANPTAAKAAEKQLADEDAATAQLLARAKQLEEQVGRLKGEAALRAQQKRKDDEWLTMPVAGASMPGSGQQPAAPQAATQPPAAPAGETAPAPMRVVLNLDPIRAQIDGSRDRPRIALSLFKAGQALTDRAEALRAQGQAAAADQCDDAARERLQHAVAELEPEASAPGAPFAELFQLGKCRELMFRIAERREGLSLRNDPKEYQRREQAVRDPFLAITARDVQTSGGNEQLGIWGRAAQTAMEHFRWLNLHRGFVPRTSLESITWPGQTQR